MSEISREDEILDEIETGLGRDILAPFKQIFVFLALAIFVIFIGIFIGDALFGKRSYEVLRDLQKEKAFLYQDTERLKKENAELQRNYLERKSLDPDFAK